MEALKRTECPNVMTDGHFLYTRNISPGYAIYGEPLVEAEDGEYRRWDHTRSKMAAYIKLKNQCGDLRQNDDVLYLGAASGTTASHISDIVNEGLVYAVEISKRAFRELLVNCSNRPNLIPILGDVRDENLLTGMIAKADYLYVDIAQRNQSDIFLSYMRRFKCRTGMLMLKCRSVDVSASPSKIAKEAILTIENSGFKVCPAVDLSRFEKDHFAILVKRSEG